MVPSKTKLIIHERRATWARRLRPLMNGRAVRLVESRAAEEARTAAESAFAPIGIFDLTDRPAWSLEGLAAFRATAEDGFALAIDGRRRGDVVRAARELGATVVMEGPARPPDILYLIDRWLHLGRQRASREGWVGDPGPDDDPIAVLIRMAPSARKP